MRRIALLAAGMLCACSTNPAPADTVEGGPLRPTPIHGVTPGHTCQSAGTDQFIGQTATGETGAAIMRITHAAVLRWGAPGYMLTMDFRADRVTVWYGPDKKITKVHCG